MQVKKLYLVLLVLITSCGSVTIPNTEVCTPSGFLSNGMDCSTTITSEVREMNFNESLDFLQASENPPKGAALCQSSEDWTAMKTALEVACELLGDNCKQDIKKRVQSFSSNIESLQRKGNISVE